MFFLSIAYNITMINDEAIGKNIRRLRVEKRKSQEELGKALKPTRSHATISDIERGKTKLSIKDLSAIAKFFGVDVQEIIGNTIETKPTASFSYGRGSFDTENEEKKRIKKAEEKFKEFVRKRARGE